MDWIWDGIHAARTKSCREAVIAISRRAFRLPPQTDIESKITMNFPIVLCIEGVVVVTLVCGKKIIYRAVVRRSQQKRSDAVAVADIVIWILLRILVGKRKPPIRF